MCKMIDVKTNRAEQVKGGRVLPAQARKGGGIRSMVVIYSAQPEAYEPRVGLAKVSAASRKVRARGHFGQINKNHQNDRTELIT